MSFRILTLLLTLAVFALVVVRGPSYMQAYVLVALGVVGVVAAGAVVLGAFR